MAKRANGEGTVARPANGTWEEKLTYADPATGQRRRVSFYGPTARAVRAKMKAARDRLEAGARNEAGRDAKVVPAFEWRERGWEWRERGEFDRRL
jgi:integrase